MSTANKGVLLSCSWLALVSCDSQPCCRSCSMAGSACTCLAILIFCSMAASRCAECAAMCSRTLSTPSRALKAPNRRSSISVMRVYKCTEFPERVRAQLVVHPPDLPSHTNVQVLIADSARHVPGHIVTGAYRGTPAEL